MLSSPAYADDFTNREIAFQVANVADAVSTCTALRNPNVVEMNPLLGSRPSCGKVAAFKVGIGVIHFLAAREIYKDDPEVAKWFQLLPTIAFGGAAVWNFTVAF